MVIVGHIVVPVMLAVTLATDLSTFTHLAIWLPLTGDLTLGLLQPVKGAIIALQWALRMHGFDGADRADRRATAIAPTISLPDRPGSAANRPCRRRCRVERATPAR